MIASLAELLRQQFLDAVNPHADVGGGQAGDFGNGRGVEIFEIGHHDLPVERFEPLDESHEAVQVNLMFRGGGASVYGWEGLNLLQADQTEKLRRSRMT